MTDTDTKNKFITLRSQGYSFDYITKRLNKSKQTLINWNKEFEDEIANMKAVELEALFESCFILKEHRIRLLASNLKLINEELGKRNLKDVPTEKLMDLAMKNLSMLKDEYIEPVFKSGEEIERDKKAKEELNNLLVME